MKVTVPVPTSAVAFEREELEQSIPQRFEAQVRLHPDRPAVIHREQVLTYSELNHRANRVAAALLSREPRRQATVAVMISQGPLRVASILGVLKADQLYVGLDPTWPTTRLRFMLEDSDARVILADQQNLARAEELAAGLPVLRLEESMAGGPAENPGRSHSPDAFAYLFYTSGSTGVPKGVVDTHRNVLHNIRRYTNGLHLCCEDRLGLLQSASFSGSISSLFGALLNGAACCPFDLAEEGIPKLAEWVRETRLSVYHSVPALFRALVGRGGSFPSVRVVRLEGDRAAPGDLELFKRHFLRPAVLVNGLGATECGLIRRFVMTHDTRLTTQTLPIGHAIEDMTVVLLDAEGREVPRGQVGEIAVRSAFLSPGYWNRQDLTERAFTFHGGERQYRTGDLGRMLPNGCLEHLGRSDHQPKVQGHRIELEAVETALIKSGSVAEAVVSIAGANDPAVIAWIVPQPNRVLSVEQLRAALAAQVPAHCIPSRFVVLDALPLDVNGKVKRTALPPPEDGRPLLDSPFVAPRTELERALAAIWQEVIHIRPIGREDRFLELGGTSLQAVELVERIDRALRISLSPRDVLEAATIGRLAEGLERSRGAGKRETIEF